MVRVEGHNFQVGLKTHFLSKTRLLPVSPAAGGEKANINSRWPSQFFLL